MVRPPRQTVVSGAGTIMRKDLDTIGQLCQSSNSILYLVEHTENKKLYCLKAYSKSHVQKRCMMTRVISEKEIQLTVSSPFIIKLYETFTDDQSVYLLLELAMGGDLHTIYNRSDLWGKEPLAQYYV